MKIEPGRRILQRKIYDKGSNKKTKSHQDMRSWFSKLIT
jgi:hypothetical protein